jgi:hypothetical protein
MKNLIGLFGVLAIVAFAPLARADFAISVNGAGCATGPGNPATPIFGEGGACANFTTLNGIAVSGLSTAGTQSSANSQQFTTTTFLTNTTTSTQTIKIDAATNDFTSPHTPPNIIDSFTYTLNETIGATTASSYQACVDAANGLTAPTGTCGSPTPLVVSGTVSNASSTGQIIITSLNPSFSLNQEITLTLTGGTSVTLTATQTLTSVPEPASIVLLGSILVGMATLFRKKVARQS